MSAKISGQIWDLDLPRCERDVLHAMADHADHEGYNVFPSVPLIAWKTNYSERQVRRAMADLRDRHILVPLREDSGKVVEYGIDLSKAPRKITYREWKKAQKTPDKMSPLTKCPSGQNVTPPRTWCQGTPDIAMSPPIKTINKPKDLTVNKKTVTETPKNETTALLKAEPLSGNAKVSRGGAAGLDPDAETLYRAYPKKVAKPEALKSITAALQDIRSDAGTRRPDTGEAWPPADAVAWLLDRIRLYAQSVADTSPRYILNPTTYFNQSRFNDEIQEGENNDRKLSTAERSAASLNKLDQYIEIADAVADSLEANERGSEGDERGFTGSPSNVLTFPPAGRYAEPRSYARDCESMGGPITAAFG